MRKSPGLDDSEISAALHDNGDSPRPVNSPFSAPDRDDSIENIEDSDDSPDIFETQVKAGGTCSRPSGLQAAFGSANKSNVTPRGNSTVGVRLFSSDLQDSFFDQSNKVKPFSNLKSHSLNFHLMNHEPLDLFKQKSKFKPVTFLYETLDKNQRSGFSSDEKQTLGKAGVEFTKIYDKWVRNYLKLTKNTPNSTKLPVIDTSHLNEFFERAKISDESCYTRNNQKKTQKSNANTQVNNGRKKNQNYINEDRGSSIAPNEDGWTPRCKEKYEKVVKPKASKFSHSSVEAEEGGKNIYSFTEEEDSAENVMTETEYDGNLSKDKIIRSKHNTSVSESNRSRVDIDVQFAFNKRLMKEEPLEIKPDQSSFRNALMGRGARNSNSEMCQDAKPGSPVQNSEDRLKGKGIVESAGPLGTGGRGRGGIARGRQDILNGAQNIRNASDASKNDRSNQQFNDVIKVDDKEEEREQNMSCPVCNQTFKMGKQLELHVNSCLDQAPRQTRSREQAYAPGR